MGGYARAVSVVMKAKRRILETNAGRGQSVNEDNYPPSGVNEEPRFMFLTSRSRKKVTKVQ